MCISYIYRTFHRNYTFFVKNTQKALQLLQSKELK